jgi:hypothetical protein
VTRGEPGERHLGMHPGELDGKPYAHHWHPRMRPPTPAVREAAARGVDRSARAPAVDEAPALFRRGRGAPGSEASIALGDDGGMHVALRTPMPGVSPAMVDWWFGWHADEPQRYKLWHPHAHVFAEWRTPCAPGARGRARYVGRMSFVDEYLGAPLGHFAIRFVSPSELGFDAAELADPREATVVCARVGFARAPLDAGYLMHYVRRTPDGAEMDSRFWLGGSLAAPRGAGGLLALAVKAGARLRKPSPAEGRALLVHCSEEMQHLASFLPGLHGELGD